MNIEKEFQPLNIKQAYIYAGEIINDPIQLHVHKFTRETIATLLLEIARLEKLIK